MLKCSSCLACMSIILSRDDGFIAAKWGAIWMYVCCCSGINVNIWRDVRIEYWWEEGVHLNLFYEHLIHVQLCSLCSLVLQFAWDLLLVNVWCFILLQGLWVSQKSGVPSTHNSQKKKKSFITLCLATFKKLKINYNNSNFKISLKACALKLSWETFWKRERGIIIAAVYTI